MNLVEAKVLALKIDELRSEKKFSESDEIRKVLITDHYKVHTTTKGTWVRWIPRSMRSIHKEWENEGSR